MITYPIPVTFWKKEFTSCTMNLVSLFNDNFLFTSCQQKNDIN